MATVILFNLFVKHVHDDRVDKMQIMSSLTNVMDSNVLLSQSIVRLQSQVNEDKLYINQLLTQVYHNVTPK